ncbi:MAG: UDP-N-acetylmuramoyl-tripeptide--D-alanyl-D-alanine ligase [Legionella sp.]|nr:UDP-N-acetylmuramoyl-tripeptide--D-alanyl-D-alanine ligase [Legionella sp.]
MLNLQTIASVLNIDLKEGEDREISSVTIDTRQVQAGDLFVAMQGPNFDGHDFLTEAVAKGAAAILCKSSIEALSVPQLVVQDTLDALTQLASYYRTTIDCPIIALTGSNGKTTVKEMIASILPKPAHATPGNLNNHIGVPLSVLQLKALHRYAVFELGANHEGEIARTVSIVQPKVALINNIAPAHIGEFGSIEAIVRAKGEIFQTLDAQGTAVINADDRFANAWDNQLQGKKVLRFSCHNPADVYAREVNFDGKGCASFKAVLPDGELGIRLKVPGKHMVLNALAAASCCFALGLPLEEIKQGLTSFQAVSGRMRVIDGKQKSIIIDDSYNANLNSVLSALAVLAQFPGRRILVLGDMAELGNWAQSHHREVGLMARKEGIDCLLTYGKMSEHASHAFGNNATHYTSQSELAQNLLSQLNQETVVLVKGSRSAAMEKIVAQLI